MIRVIEKEIIGFFTIIPGNISMEYLDDLRLFEFSKAREMFVKKRKTEKRIDKFVCVNKLFFNSL